MKHWFQIIRTGMFQMYDEMPSRLPYHTSNVVMDHVPPKFPTKQIKTPIAIFYGGSDSLVDFDVLSADLPHPLAYVKAVERWEHLDFLWAEGIEKVVFPDILKLLNHFNPPVDGKPKMLIDTVHRWSEIDRPSSITSEGSSSDQADKKLSEEAILD